MTIDRDALARAYDPVAFEDHPIEARSAIAAIQWSARRKMATDAADRVVVSDWLTAHDADVRKAALEEAAQIADRQPIPFNAVAQYPVRADIAAAIRAAALGDAPQMSSEQTNERDELILTVRDVDADYHGTGPLALSGAEAALIADAVLAAGYHRDAPNGGE